MLRHRSAGDRGQGDGHGRFSAATWACAPHVSDASPWDDRIAAQTGLSPKAVRLYGANGLIDAPERTAAGYRTYTDEAIPVLGFIRQAQAQALGLGLKEILDLPAVRRAAPCSFSDVVSARDR